MYHSMRLTQNYVVLKASYDSLADQHMFLSIGYFAQYTQVAIQLTSHPNECLWIFFTQITYFCSQQPK